MHGVTSQKISGLNLLVAWDPSVWILLAVVPAGPWSLPSLFKGKHIRLNGDFKLALSVDIIVCGCLPLQWTGDLSTIYPTLTLSDLE